MTNKDFDKIDEIELWKKYRKNQDLEIRNYFVEKYLSLVKYVVGRVQVKLANNVEYDDLLSYGIFGLFDAIDKFSPERKIKFKTYAVQRINGTIYDELRSIDWVSRSVRQQAKEIENAKAQLEDRLGRSCSNTELADSMRISPEELNKKLMKVSGTNLISLDEMRYTGDDNDKVSIVESLESPSSLNPDVQIQRNELKIIIRDAIMELPENSQKVLILYYYEDLTLKEIGKILGVTESRVSQLHTKAAEKLRVKLEGLKRGLF